MTREYYRTHQYKPIWQHQTGETAEMLGTNKNVHFAGWVHRIRDHGGLLFIDLRDNLGLMQCVVDPESPAFAVAETLHAEFVIRVTGDIRKRPEGTENPDLETGELEVAVSEIEILNECKELPLPVFGEPDYPEETRLKYRYLDLRRAKMKDNILKRSAIIARMREIATERGNMECVEIQTPILTASSPEGARDFIIPSRLNPGSWYAVPQSPQVHKQMLMMSGIDRYFQVAAAFRDEDSRSDRLHGEFYQLDVEMAFVKPDEFLEDMGRLAGRIFKEFAPAGYTAHGIARDSSHLPRIPQITYADAMAKYATDKPDLRNPIEFRDATDHFRDCGFALFADMVKKPGVQVWGLPAKGAGSVSFCKKMNDWAIREQKQPGLGYIYYDGEKGSGPIAKNAGPAVAEALRTQFELEIGDGLFFIAGKPAHFAQFADAARMHLGHELGLIDEKRFELCWIVDFPFYEWNGEAKKIEFGHNPFSHMKGGLEALENDDPLTITAEQFDLVCNGYEIGSGAVRNHKPAIMRKAFEIAGYSEAELQAQFGGMLTALEYGAPPHMGMALGIDRIVMLCCAETNIRNVVAFPLSAQGKDHLLGAPTKVPAAHLRELNLRLIEEPTA